MEVAVEIGAFKGKPTITLRHPPDSQYGFSFGKKKAAIAVLNGKEKIERFINGDPLDDPCAVVGDFQGHSTLQLKSEAGHRYGFTFGRTKAMLIVAAWDNIVAFSEVSDEDLVGYAKQKGGPE